MIRAAMIGCGEISGVYLKNLILTFKEVQLKGVCDLKKENAEKARAYVHSEIEKGAKVPEPVIYRDMTEAFKDPEVDIILNITPPLNHYEITKKALLSGKHVYSEKPLASTLEEGMELVQLAKEKGLFLGGAPDTFLGAGIQTCRKLIDDGVIGDVIGANVSMICHGHESWHPNPDFFYQRAGDPVMDMGPYYITALVNLLGPAKGLVGLSKRSFEERVITSAPRFGERIKVENDTYITGNVLFENGAVASVFMTYDVYYKKQPHFEVYGTLGTLVVPDPNTFGGPVLLYRPEDDLYGPSVDPGLLPPVKDPYEAFREIPLMFDYRENSRGLGLADMAKAIESGREVRACMEQQLHVLEIMTAFRKSSESGKFLEMKTRFERKAPMKNNPLHGVLDE